MRRPNALEVGDVFRVHDQAFATAYRGSVSREQWKVVRALKHCRTGVLGGHIEKCTSCEHQRIAYNSCRNRHCPKCQSGARAKWMAAREQELLPVPYFHVVFTIPQPLSAITLQNKAVLYNILFQAAAETLKSVAANPKHLGAKIGFLAILHTWGQTLTHHPHIHCVVPAGGLSTDGTEWIHCRRSKRGKKAFFLPVRVLSRVFRGKFIHRLKRAYFEGQLTLVNQLAALREPGEFNSLLDVAVRKDWVVYAKRPFGGPSQVLKYLARYTHRVAISNQRLVRMDGDQVTFSWKDYSKRNQVKQMTLHACEFMRRFLMHTLPSGFTRIRHYGFLANRNRKANLETCRRLLRPTVDVEVEEMHNVREAKPVDLLGWTVRCPRCSDGRMIIVELLCPDRSNLPSPHFCRQRQSAADPEVKDTS